jgi:hypothetical protein
MNTKQAYINEYKKTLIYAIRRLNFRIKRLADVFFKEIMKSKIYKWLFGEIK